MNNSFQKNIIIILKTLFENIKIYNRIVLKSEFMINRGFKEQDFRGYKQSEVPKIDEGLARTNSNTPCGEYLRRYWHPVALTSEISEIPKEIRILGEDLVIFKTTKGNIGLIHKACPHRRASMVYGKTEDKGITCCYHDNSM